MSASSVSSTTQKCIKNIKLKKSQKQDLECNSLLRISFFFSLCIYLVLLLCLVSPMFVFRRRLPSNVLYTASTSASMIQYLSFLLNASEYHVGAWAPRVWGQALAEGEIPCLWCSMPWRVSVGFMYVLPLALDVLPKACGSLVIRDSGIIALFYLVVNVVDCLSFAERNPRLSTAMFCLPSVISLAYLLGSSYPAPAFTWTHVIAQSNSRDEIARALKTNTIWRDSLPTGAWLGLFTWLGLTCAQGLSFWCLLYAAFREFLTRAGAKSWHVAAAQHLVRPFPLSHISIMLERRSANMVASSALRPKFLFLVCHLY